MSLFAVADSVWSGAIVVIGGIVVVWLNNRAAGKAQTAALAAAKEVREVKDTLADTTTRQDKKLDDIHEVGKSNHSLLNGGMLIQLRLGAELSRFKATITNKPEDLQAAELADKMLAEHIANQQAVPTSVANPPAGG